MQAQGFVAPGYERVRDIFEAAQAEELGAAFAAVRDGEVVVDLWGGWADRAETRPWTQTTIPPVFSTTGIAVTGFARSAIRPDWICSGEGLNLTRVCMLGLPSTSIV